MSRWAAYCRVSTSMQAVSGLGLADQEQKLRAWGTFNGHDIELFVDAGESGKNTDRPELQRALAACRRREFDGLVVVKLDRLSRSVKDLLDLMDLFKSDDGPGFVSCQESFDTRTAMGRFVLLIFGAMAQLERELIGERTSAALAVKTARGEYTGGFCRIGERLDDDGVSVVPDGAEMAAAREAAHLHRLGWSLRQIGTELDRRGHKPRGKAWHPSAVSRLLDAASTK